MRTEVKRNVGKVELTFTIWDNFNGVPGNPLLPGHANVLRKMGATDADIDRLRQAAVAVDEATQGSQAIAAAADTDAAAAALAPVDCGLEHPLRPATKALRHWMATAVRKVSGGQPDAGDGFLHSISAAMHIAVLWQSGRKDEAMRLVSANGAMAEALPGICEAFAGVDPDGLVNGYLALMGLTGAAIKKKALETYHELVLQLVQRLADQFSASGSPPDSGLVAPGTSGGTASQPESST